MNRRRFISGIAATMTVGGLVTVRASAEELPRVSEDDPTAKALGYVHDATTVDASARPADRFCYNCQLYQADADAPWGGCAIFPGKAVAGKGWCKSWVPRAS